MLKFLKSTFGAVVLGAISLVFVLSFGPGSSGCQGANPNAKIEYALQIDNDNIGEGVYREKFREVKQSFRAMGKSVSSDDIANATKAEMIKEYILLKEAKRLGLTVSHEERNLFIEKMPAFQNNGKFDFTKYKQALTSYYGTTPVRFEEGIDRMLVIKKVRDLLTSPIMISNNDLWKEFASRERNVEAKYIKFLPPVTKNQVNISDVEAKSYLKTHLKETKAFFTKNPDKYKHAPEVKASHILVKVDSKASKADQDKGLEKIKSIEKELKAGKSFEELAKAHSDCPSKTKGGDLGYFTKDRMVKPFSKKAFSMKKGEISGPVKTQFGYHLIRVDDKKESRVETFDTAKIKIAKQLLKDERFKKELSALKKEIAVLKKGVKTLDEITKAKEGLTIKSSNKIYSYMNYIQGIGRNSKLVKDLFSATKGSVLADIYESNDTLYVVQLVNVNEAKRKDFDQQKQFLAQIKNSRLAQEKDSFLQNWLMQKQLKMKIFESPILFPQTKKK